MADTTTTTTPDPTPDPTPGRIVLYTLTDADAARIEIERNANGTRGVVVAEGDVVPLVVVSAVERIVSGQAILNGSDNLHAADAPEGDEPGTWRYPARV